MGTDISTLFKEIPDIKVFLKSIVGELSKKLKLFSCVKIFGSMY